MLNLHRQETITPRVTFDHTFHEYNYVLDFLTNYQSDTMESLFEQDNPYENPQIPSPILLFKHKDSNGVNWRLPQKTMWNHKEAENFTYNSSADGTSVCLHLSQQLPKLCNINPIEIYSDSPYWDALKHIIDAHSSSTTIIFNDNQALLPESNLSFPSPEKLFNPK